MNVRMWIIVLCGIFLLSIGTLFTANFMISQRVFNDVTMPQITDALRQKYEYGVKSAVEVEAQNLANRLKNVSDKKEQYAIIEQLTDYQRFFPNNEGYYFTYTTDGMRINVPINKSLNGKDCSGLKDANGVPFVRKFMEVAKAGGGFVEYSFEKPGAGIQPKLSYVCLIPGTDALIGTGVYIDSVQAEQQRIAALVAESNDRYSMYQVWICLGIVVLMILVAWYVTRVICSPLRQLTGAADEVAKGRLDTKINLHPRCPREIRALDASLGQMIGTLRERIDEAARKSEEATAAVEEATVAQREAEEARQQAESAKKDGMLAAAGQLEGIVEILSSASTELSAQIEQSDRGAHEAAGRVSEAATAMDEMNATVQEVARNATSASAASADTKQKAQAGSAIVEKAVHGIEQVRQLSLELKDDMGQLNEHAQAITQIMNVISDIADQTNLLALNAAIEAARAGDAGRGFAVVADEVRKLAEKTMASTNDVSNAIRAIQESTSKSMASVDNAVRRIEEATDYASQSGSALEEIVATVEVTADQVNAIATASEEQSAASEEINQSILQVNDMGRQIAEAMGGASKAVTDLAVQARKLTDLIQDMKRG
ncbi:methyl-accepting chemotaxis protein [Desulfovibrio sp.]|uniref:methyl-accepting chemotaxis protein n=1 Tax=Desulfovibrio sp. TaxID=885 RepID=UPI0025BFBDF7|nr:methyl-accepting chemotaxis protein [Desulfovibrio sp.]